MRWTKVTGYSVFARSSDSLSVENGKLNEKAKRLSLSLGPQSIPVVYISKERLSRWGLTTTRARKCPRSKCFEVITSCHFYIIREALREMLNCLREHCRYSTAWTQLAWHGLISLPFWSEQVKATGIRWKLIQGVCFYANKRHFNTIGCEKIDWNRDKTVQLRKILNSS